MEPKPMDLGAAIPEEQLKAIREQGGYCHRRTWVTQTIGQVPPQIVGGQAGIAVQSSVGGAPCVGKLGICPMWDEEREQCLDRTVAMAKIGADLKTGRRELR